MKNRFKNVERELTLLVALVAIVIVFTIINPIYISVLNISDIIEQSVIFGLMGIGMTFVIITGGIDLSVGSILALTAVTAAKLSSGGMNVVGVFVISILLSAVLGTANGFMVSRMKLQPFIATMGSMSVYRGIAYIITDGFPVSGVDSAFRNIFYGKIAVGLRSSVVVLLVFAILAHILLKYTRFGSYVYAMGGNEEATRLSGVKVNSNKIKAYIICGIGSGLAALILIAKLASGEPTAGNGYELNAIAAACIGGTSMAGGRGTIAGTVIGAILFSALKVGLITSGVDTFWQYVATGVVIIIAAYVEIIQGKLAGRKKKSK